MLLKKTLFFVCLFYISFSQSMEREIDTKSCIWCFNLKDSKLFFKEGEFYVKSGEKQESVNKEYLDNSLVGISSSDLDKVLLYNYCMINKMCPGGIVVKLYPIPKTEK